MLYSSHSEAVLRPVCHIRNLMLWTAVYLPCSTPTTPIDDSCAPFPPSGANPEEQLLGRRPKTRSFDNLPSACEVGNSYPSNRRSSDPSLNEKWQDNRRSLEITIVAGPDCTIPQVADGSPNGRLGAGINAATLDRETKDVECLWDINCVRLPVRHGVEAEFLVGMAVGQMENILQEAAADRAENPVFSGGTENKNCNTGDLSEVERNGIINTFEIPVDSSSEGLNETKLNSFHSVLNDTSYDTLTQLPHAADELIITERQEIDELGEVSEKCTTGEALNPQCTFSPSHSPYPTLRTMNNGCWAEGSRTVKRATEMNRPVSETAEKRLSLLESSTETLTEDLGVRAKTLITTPIFAQPRIDPMCLKSSPELLSESQGAPRILNGTNKQPCLGAFPVSSSPAEPLQSVCNGDPSDPELSTPQRVLLSRQFSLASCNCPVQRCTHWGRSHLDDDGLMLHTDAVQQRLRQIEVGHQLEVEVLKRQVQELWSRLQSQQATVAHRCLSGDLGDDVTSMSESDFNLDPNCLSRCSTELFSEASWEQVDKQDTEVTRWYPDHLAAQCYGCERGFWLATRRHHCRDCGNVFCAGCCDQKIPVPSQQLFEPSRVCKACYSNLQLPAPPLELEFDKSIMASSN